MKNWKKKKAKPFRIRKIDRLNVKVKTEQVKGFLKKTQTAVDSAGTFSLVIGLFLIGIVFSLFIVKFVNVEVVAASKDISNMNARSQAAQADIVFVTIYTFAALLHIAPFIAFRKKPQTNLRQK